MAVQNIIGERFGRLTVLSRYTKKLKPTKWNCICDCGVEKAYYAANLKRGLSRSCGCLRKEEAAQARRKHGLVGTPEYYAWSKAIQRCTNPKDSRYNNYGARGITVCEEWLDFRNFIADMGKRPSDDHSIDRIDNDKGYYPNNCRWATRSQQIRNRQSKNKYGQDGITKRGESYRAVIGVEGKDIYIGSFSTVDEAIAERKKAEQEYWSG
jgi:hypothetical protein